MPPHFKSQVTKFPIKIPHFNEFLFVKSNKSYRWSFDSCTTVRTDRDTNGKIRKKRHTFMIYGNYINLRALYNV